jgi:F-type H+-transporting ATPase subunit delta
MADSDRIEAYADALSQVAQAEGDASRVENELFQLARAYEGSDQLRDTLTNAHLPVEKRAQIVSDVLGGNASSTTVALASMVVGNGRARDLPGIVDAMVRRGAASRSHAVAEIRTAVPLSDDQKARLAAALGQRTGQEIEIKAIVDPTVKGGVLAQIGDEVIDGTVRNRLSKLRESFS